MAAAAIWSRSRYAATPDIPAPGHTDDEVTAWFETVVLAEREAWVDENAAVIVALLVLEPGWIDQLYVDPDFTDRGLGSRLLGVGKAASPAGLDLWTFQGSTSSARHISHE